MNCIAEHQSLGDLRTIVIANDVLSATLLLDKGADIYELRYLPKDIDVLWKSPWGLHLPGRASTFPTSFEAWVESWGGGWPVLFPSGGGPSSYKGAALHFHGEASILPWSCDAMNVAADRAWVTLSVRLVRSPFRLVRTVQVDAGSPTLVVQERIVNEAHEAMEYMWVHHPTFGAPFLGPACQVDCGATTLAADDEFDVPHSPLRPGQVAPWHPDLVRVSSPDEPRQLLGYLSDFSSGWFAITNTELDLGVGLTWPASVLPYAWVWQELHGSTGYPWYGNTYTMAIEPSSSVPNAGLANVMERTGTQRCLEPGETAEIELRAVFYEGIDSVRAISPDGTVHT